MSFSPDRNYGIGEMLEMKIRLPLTPPVMMYLYGVVVETDAQAVCARYVAITDEIRDIIVRFVFQKQREILRSQRKD
jgi:hypothetical protein